MSNRIAIVGIGCRFPGGANSAGELWQMLMDGTDAISDVLPNRWSAGQFYNPQRGVVGKSATKWAGQVEDIDRFDCDFFGISPREASLMDPQQRMLLEVCWEALEDAGQVPARWYGRRVGVFVGGFTLDYMLMQLGNMDLKGVESHTATGSMMTLLANRLSYVFGFTGPSVTTDTACSSSLIAVHQACTSLLSGESDMAVAGGVNALLTPCYTVAESRAGMLSPTGRSRAFDAAADGYVRGEGAGLVVLKRADRAIADGDHIYALIRASAMNHDGHSEGLTVPSGDAQMALMRQALDRAGISPWQVSYAEAHGTGTPVGDPIEARAIGTVLREGRDGHPDCLMGSIKTNIGHTEAAAGVAGLIKAALVMNHRQVPPHLHLKEVNPAISLDELRLSVPVAPAALPDEGELFACVNSFGFGGANAHVVLSSFGQEGSARIQTGTRASEGQEVTRKAGAASSHGEAHDHAGPLLLPLSAGDERSLRAMATDLAAHLRIPGASSRVRDVCRSASLHRQHLSWRACAVASHADELIGALSALGQDASGNPEGSFFDCAHVNHYGSAGLVFVYTGMGPQWHEMGRTLYRRDRVFAQALDQVMDMLGELGCPLRQQWLESGDDPASMNDTIVAQPANFALQVAITRWLSHYGIRPDVCVGHSAGEPAAAWAAGVFSLKDAARISWARSHLQQTTSGQGAMMAVGGLSEGAVREMIDAGDYGTVSVAAVNSPRALTLAGDSQEIDRLHGALEAAGHFAKKLRVNVAYHSAFMDPIRDALLDELGDVVAQEAHIPLYSTVTGGMITGNELDAGYWWRNVRQPVLFMESVRGIMDGFPGADWVEIGPHPVLAQSIRETAAESGAEDVRCWSSLHRKRDERDVLAQLLASLYVRGHDPDWGHIQGEGRFSPLPRRRWQDLRLWYEMPAARHQRTDDPVYPLLARRVGVAAPVWEVDLLAPRLGWLEDHRISGAQVLPGAAYVSMALQAAADMHGDAHAFSVTDIQFERALIWSVAEKRSVQFSIDPDTQHFAVSSRMLDSEAGWVQHCQGRLEFSRARELRPGSLSGLRDRLAGHEPGETAERCYEGLRRLGLDYGPAFQGISGVWKQGNEILARLCVPSPASAQLGDYTFHPVLMDLCLQVIATGIPQDDDSVYMPVGLEEVRCLDTMQPVMWAHAQVSRQEDGGLRGSVALYREDGRLAAIVQGCRVTAIDAAAEGQNRPQELYGVQWDERPLTGEVSPAEPGAWILCGPDASLEKALVQRLERQGNTVRVLDDAQAGGADGRGQLAGLMKETGQMLRGVVHLSGTGAGRDSLDGLREQTASALHIMQAMADASAHVPVGQRPRLWLVTRGCLTVDDGAVSRPGGRALWGLGRVFGHAEQASLWGGMIDLEEGASAEEDAEHILAECMGGDDHDEIAWRQGVRYAARLARLERSLDSGTAPVISARGVYVVTGGLGGLGLETARWLISRGARNLLLLGRSGLPPRQNWQDQTMPAQQRHRVDAVRALEGMGAHVEVAAVDVGDLDALKACLHRYRQQTQLPVRGVVHSAGTTENHLLDAIDDEQFFSIFSPKVLGAWNLHTALMDDPLDFFIAYSSATVQVASSGQGNYAAANACLDALMAWRQSQGLPGLAIGWGPWRDAGLARDLDLIDFYIRRGLHPLTNDQGASALSALLGYPGEHGTVLAAVWLAIVRTSPLGRAAALLKSLVDEEIDAEDSAGTGSGGKVSLKELLREADSGKRQEVLTVGLRDLVGEVMGLRGDALGVDESFSGRGMDSMMAVEIKNRIEYQLDVNVAMVELLRGASAKSLADSILPELLLDAGGDMDVDALVDELAGSEEEDILELIREMRPESTDSSGLP